MSGPDRLLAGLTEEQREAVTTEATPLLVLAGAGSGKTRVLTRRIAWHAVLDRIDARRVMAVTFTRKAASELRRRLRDLGLAEDVTAGTFHGLALALLRRRWLDQGRRLPKLVDRKSRIVGRILPGAGGGIVGAVVREIEWAQARDLDPPAYAGLPAGSRPGAPLPPGEMASAYESYVQEKRRRGVVDFDDLLALAAAEVERDPEFAAAVRWRFRHLFVDEFQDLSPSQFRLLLAWLGDRRDLFAVGDDDQAIYGFGGADRRYVAGFDAYFGDDATVLRLTANFRSTPQILAVANAVIAPAPGDARRLRAQAGDGPQPVLTAYESHGAEGAGIVRTISRLQRDGVRPGDVAVLARTNAQCVGLEEALGAARIPARRRGAVRFLDRPEVERVLALLREAEQLEDPTPFPALVARAVGHVPRVGADGDAVLAVLTELGEEYALHEGDMVTTTGFRDYVAAHVRDDDPMPARDAVEVLTFHRAKGLEWPVVFVTGLEDGFVPIAHARTDVARAEERRLLHVALTRAQRRLFLSWARSRAFGGRPVAREPTPLLAGLDALLPSDPDGDGERTGDAATGREVLAEVARRLRETEPLAPAGGPSPIGRSGTELLDALVAWRDRRARAAGVPEAAIVDDVTLRTISATLPLDEEALANLPGLGAARVARYGPEILELVSGYSP